VLVVVVVTVAPLALRLPPNMSLTFSMYRRALSDALQRKQRCQEIAQCRDQSQQDCSESSAVKARATRACQALMTARARQKCDEIAMVSRPVD